VDPAPILYVLAEADPVDKVPAWVTVTVRPSATVTSPTVVVAKVTVEFAVNCTFDPDAQAVVNGPAPDEPQLLPVQVALVPSVLQNCCASALLIPANVTALMAIAVNNFFMIFWFYGFGCLAHQQLTSGGLGVSRGYRDVVCIANRPRGPKGFCVTSLSQKQVRERNCCHGADAEEGPYWDSSIGRRGFIHDTADLAIPVSRTPAVVERRFHPIRRSMTVVQPQRVSCTFGDSLRFLLGHFE